MRLFNDILRSQFPDHTHEVRRRRDPAVFRFPGLSLLPDAGLVDEAENLDALDRMRWLPLLLCAHPILSRAFVRHRAFYSPFSLSAQSNQKEQYSNQLTAFLGHFLSSSKQSSGVNAAGSIDEVDWQAKKRRNLRLEQLVSALKTGLTRNEWFVTGAVDPTLFSDDFAFKDPDVQLKGIRPYAEGVNRLFDQSCSRAELIDIRIVDRASRLITVTWRLEGRVRVGPGLRIKPYVVYTDFRVNEEGLVCFQEDRFSVPGYDILLSALFPFLQAFLAPPAPPADELRRNLNKIS